jgi:hypothetical protein
MQSRSITVSMKNPSRKKDLITLEKDKETGRRNGETL